MMSARKCHSKSFTEDNTAAVLRDIVLRSGILDDKQDQLSSSSFSLDQLIPTKINSKWEREKFDYDNNEAIHRLQKNANLAELLSMRIDIVQHSGLPCFEGRVPLVARRFNTSNGDGDTYNEAISIRRQQNRRLAMSHVECGAELTRSGRCFEAIQCFNRAINVDEDCADAYVGRGAACAGNSNFTGALSDFEKALQLDPEHRNAKRYRIEVLIAYGKGLEKKGQLMDAYLKYSRAYQLSENTNERAANAMQRLYAYRPTVEESVTTTATPSTKGVEIVDLASDDDDHKGDMLTKL